MRLSAALVAVALVVGCQQSVQPSPTPTTSPTATRPRFELASYQFALQTKGKIRVAIRSNASPLSDQPVTGNSIGKARGFEPDIAREIAKAIFGTADDPDSHIEWISVDDSTRVVALTSAQADISISAITITDDTRKTIDLSDPYLTVGQRLLVKRSNDQIKEIADVATGEQTVCAVKDSKSEAELKKITNDRAKILELSTFDFCLQALTSGAADAIVADEIALLAVVAKQPNDLKLAGKAFATEALGIGIKKNVTGDRQGFLEFVNSTLLAIVASRTWAKLYQQDVAPVSGDAKQLPTD
jgi:ABC-type amino acid transport substrate-binding protein